MSNIILAIGAIIIFGTFLSSSNRLMTGNTQIAEQNEYYLSALSLAQSIIDEAKGKAYDQKTVSGSVSIPDSLTPSISFGWDVGESVPSPDTLNSSSPYTSAFRGYCSTYKFNDVDDYNSYIRQVNTPRTEGYLVKVSVSYASATYPDSLLSSKSWCKQITVKVSNPYMSDTVKLSYAFTY